MLNIILGLCIANGDGVKQDYKKAAKLYQKAADQGFNDAYTNLGILYVLGNGVKQDKIKTYQLWMEAAKLGDTSAQKNLDILCKQSPWACK